VAASSGTWRLGDEITRKTAKNFGELLLLAPTELAEPVVQPLLSDLYQPLHPCDRPTA
jgi:hypothetical protein